MTKAYRLGVSGSCRVFPDASAGKNRTAEQGGTAMSAGRNVSQKNRPSGVRRLNENQRKENVMERNKQKSGRDSNRQVQAGNPQRQTQKNPSKASGQQQQHKSNDPNDASEGRFQGEDEGIDSTQMEQEQEEEDTNEDQHKPRRA
jgi:hypothetical protein